MWACSRRNVESAGAPACGMLLQLPHKVLSVVPRVAHSKFGVSSNPKEKNCALSSQGNVEANANPLLSHHSARKLPLVALLVWHGATCCVFLNVPWIYFWIQAKHSFIWHHHLLRKLGFWATVFTSQLQNASRCSGSRSLNFCLQIKMYAWNLTSNFIMSSNVAQLNPKPFCLPDLWPFLVRDSQTSFMFSTVYLFSVDHFHPCWSSDMSLCLWTCKMLSILFVYSEEESCPSVLPIASLFTLEYSKQIQTLWSFVKQATFISVRQPQDR